jgi:hypothetical protein
VENVSADGKLTTLHIEVRPSRETRDHEVCLLGNGEDLIHSFSPEMMGMDPEDLLVEPCRLRAENVSHTATIGRCCCGMAGCGLLGSLKPVP